MLNKKCLKSAMILNGDTQTALASALGISRISVNRKISGAISFTLPEIDTIIQRYGLSADEIVAIFFSHKVD